MAKRSAESGVAAAVEAAPARPRPKRQHYVPRLHLSRFVGQAPKNMIWTFDNQTEKWRPSKVENTAVQSNFYSIETEDGWNDGIDDLLGEIEAAAVPGYEMLLADKVPTQQARADFATFLATLHLRTPAVINAFAQGEAEVMDRIADMFMEDREAYERFAAERTKRTGEPPVSHERFMEFKRDKSRYTLQVSQKRGLSAIGAADRITPILFDRNWFVCTPLTGYFISSDHPVYRGSPSEPDHEIKGDGGFMNEKAEVSFPLSPNRLLIIIANGPAKEGEPMVLMPEQVDAANQMRAYAAERYVYSHLRNDDVGKLAIDQRDHQHRLGIIGPGETPEVKIVR
jgi:hypothetical protein